MDFNIAVNNPDDHSGTIAIDAGTDGNSLVLRSLLTDVGAIAPSTQPAPATSTPQTPNSKPQMPNSQNNWHMDKNWLREPVTPLEVIMFAVLFFAVMGMLTWIFKQIM